MGKPGGTKAPTNPVDAFYIVTGKETYRDNRGNTNTREYTAITFYDKKYDGTSPGLTPFYGEKITDGADLQGVAHSIQSYGQGSQSYQNLSKTMSLKFGIAQNPSTSTGYSIVGALWNEASAQPWPVWPIYQAPAGISFKTTNNKEYTLKYICTAGVVPTLTKVN